MRELNRALIQLVCAGAGVCGYVCILDSSSGRVAIMSQRGSGGRAAWPGRPGYPGRPGRAGLQARPGTLRLSQGGAAHTRKCNQYSSVASVIFKCLSSSSPAPDSDLFVLDLTIIGSPP